MLRVNEAKLIQDFQVLVDKRTKSIAKIESETRAFALGTLGYNESKAEEFVQYVLNQGNGLSESDSERLSILNAYIDEIADDDEPLDDETIQPSIAPASVVNI